MINLKKMYVERKYLVLGFLIIIIIIISISLVLSKKNRFVLNKIYDIYPSEVRGLYQNVVSVSCNGDLYFDIEKEKEYEVSNINKNNLLDYMFSYLDKNNKLSNTFDYKLLKDTQEELFNNVNILDNFKSYDYGDYAYTLDNNKIIRKNHECVSSNKYISHLYGYSYNSDMLSLDVSISYMLDNVLYDLDNNKLGNYIEDKEELVKLMSNCSYYQLKYKKNGKNYKLISITLKNKD